MVVFEHAAPAWLIWVGLAAAVVVSLLSFRRFMPREVRTFVLLTVRLLFLALLTWCLFLPGRKNVLTETRKPHFVVMVDTSGSMRLSPAAEISNRWAVAGEVWRQPWTRSVAEACELDAYAFAAEVGPKLAWSDLAGLQPDGAATLLRDALNRIVSRQAGLNVAGALLISDGIDTREASDDWAAMAGCPFPVYTVLLEPETGWTVEPDVRVDTVTTPRRVTMGWKTELKATVSGQGTRGAPVTVQLHRNGVMLEESPTLIPDGGGAKQVVFELDHPEVGLYTYEVALPPLAGESNTNDNRYGLSIQVVTSRDHLLYVEGTPRWESKYLTRALRANPRMSALVFVRGPGGEFMTFGQRGSMTADMQKSQLAFFKIVVLGNLTAGELGPERAGNLVKFVEAGGSLILLGGGAAWDANGFPSTPLKVLLPIRNDGLNLIEGRFPVTLTDAGRAHPAFAGDAALWDAIPPVLSVFPNAAPSVGAQTLVAAETPEGPQPVIVTHRYGQGKVTAVLTDSFWKWQLSPDALESRPYQRFWDQMISWMTPEQEQLEGAKLDLFADREEVYLGEPVELSARRATAGAGTNAQPFAVRCEVTAPDGRTLPFTMGEQQVVTASGGAFSGYAVTFTAEAPGLYTAVARPETAGQEAPSDPISFFVKPFTPETMPRPANVNVLRSIAESSGGRYFRDIAALDEALSALQFSGIEEEISEYASLWQRGLVIGLLMALLVAAWCLRKWMNMP